MVAHVMRDFRCSDRVLTSDNPPSAFACHTIFFAFAENMASKVASTVRNLPLSPVVTGALLYALTKAPDRVRAPLLQRLRQYVSADFIRRSITVLKWLCAFGAVRNCHIFLNELAQNNFRLTCEKARYNWPKEVAVVTGAASGFGALIAKGLAAKGVNIVAVDIRDDLPQEMKGQAKIHYYHCDITDREAVMQLAETVRSAHGDPSILINNAGVAYEHSLLDASEKGLRNTYNVNIIAHYFTLQAFLPAMIAAKKGHVVALASMASFVSPPGLIPYCNTKAALLSLHEDWFKNSEPVIKRQRSSAPSCIPPTPQRRLHSLSLQSSRPRKCSF